MVGRPVLRSLVVVVLLLVVLLPAAAGAAGSTRAAPDMEGDRRISGPRAVLNEGHPAAAYSETSRVYLVVREDERNHAAWATDIYGRLVAG